MHTSYNIKGILYVNCVLSRIKTTLNSLRLPIYLVVLELEVGQDLCALIYIRLTLFQSLTS